MATQQDLDAVETRATDAEAALLKLQQEYTILERSKKVSEVKDSKTRALPACMGKYGETFKVNPKGCRTCFAHVQCKEPAAPKVQAPVQ